MNKQQIFYSFKKEIWEFKKTLFWVPVVLAVITVLAPVIKFLLLDSYQTERIFNQLSRLENLTDFEGFSNMILAAETGLFAPFIMVGLVIQLYYFTACLFDERRDMSIYFWRSLPVADGLSVGSKLLTGALVIPAIFMLAATAALVIFLVFAFIGCIVLSVGYDISLWQLWAESGFVTNLVAIWLNLFLYALWMFPVYAWVMLASMFAKKAPFLWAVLPIVIILLVEVFVVEYFGFHSGFFTEMLHDYFAFGAELFPQNIRADVQPKFILASALSEKISLVATLVGCGLMYLTYWLRVNRSHD